MQHDLPAGLGGGAPSTQWAVAAQGAERGDAGGADRPGVAGRAGDRLVVFVHGEVIDGEPALDRGLQRLGLDPRLVSGVLDRAAQIPGAVGRVAVPLTPRWDGGHVVLLA